MTRKFRPLINRPIQLKPLTGKGRNRVREHNSIGKVLEVRDKVLFSTEPGPWLKVNAGDVDFRWVHLDRDRDFMVFFLDTNDGRP